MVLIKCIECGNEISDKATVCPHCGIAIASGTEELNTIRTAGQNETAGKKIKKKKNVFYSWQINCMYLIPFLVSVFFIVTGLWCQSMSLFYSFITILVASFVISLVCFIMFLVRDKESKKVGSIIRAVIVFILIVILIGQCRVRYGYKETLFAYEVATSELHAAGVLLKNAGFSKDNKDITMLAEMYGAQAAATAYEIAYNNILSLDPQTLAEIVYMRNVNMRLKSKLNEIAELGKLFN